MTLVLCGALLGSCIHEEAALPVTPTPATVQPANTRVVDDPDTNGRPVATTQTPIRLINTPTIASIASRHTAPVEASLFTHGDRMAPYVALTFDACQAAGSRPTGYDETIVRILEDTQTPATFFLGGLWMEQHQEETKALSSNPLFELGNHSWSHPDFADLDQDQAGWEIQRTQDVMYTLIGRPATLFRFPYGSSTDEALQVVAQYGLTSIGWDVNPGDPDPQVSARDLISTVTGQVRSGSIIIFHVNGAGRHTAEALPEIIRQLHDRGFTFVTVSQMKQENTSTND